MEMIKSKINQAKTIEELTSIYHAYPEWNIQLSSDFTTKRVQLQEAMKQPSINYQPNFTRYGNNATTASQG